MNHTGEHLLSIDVDALIRKRAEHSHSSPDHYVVVLTSLLSRLGATWIDLTIKGDQVELKADAGPLPQNSLQAFSSLVDLHQPQEARLAALELLDETRDIDLLAILAPAPARVELRSGALSLSLRDPGSRAMACSLNQAAPALSDQPGFELVLSKVGKKMGLETRLMVEFCRFSSVRIRVNRVLVSQGTWPQTALAAGQVPRRDTWGPGLVWLPGTGELSRIHILRNGVLTGTRVVRPARGIIFEAAVESPDGSPRPGMGRGLTVLAEGLYQELAQARPRGINRDRADELLFLNYRETGDPRLLDLWRPFLTGAGAGLGISEVRARSEAGSLTARVIAAPEQELDELHGGEDLLLLSNRQWEFLVNQAGLNLERSDRPGSRGRLPELPALVLGRLKALLSSGPGAPIPRTELSNRELQLLADLESLLADDQPRIEMTRGPRGTSAWLVSDSAPPLILLNGNNRDVRLALSIPAGDPDTVILVKGLLLDPLEELNTLKTK